MHRAVLARRAGRIGEARRILEEQLAGSDPELFMVPVLRIQLADMSRHARAWKDALEQLEVAASGLTDDPFHDPWRRFIGLLRAQIYLELGRPDQAAHFLARVAGVVPEQDPAGYAQVLEVSSLLGMAMDDYDSVRDAIETAMAGPFFARIEEATQVKLEALLGAALARLELLEPGPPTTGSEDVAAPCARFTSFGIRPPVVRAATRRARDHDGPDRRNRTTLRVRGLDHRPIADHGSGARRRGRAGLPTGPEGALPPVARGRGGNPGAAPRRSAGRIRGVPFRAGPVV